MKKSPEKIGDKLAYVSVREHFSATEQRGIWQKDRFRLVLYRHSRGGGNPEALARLPGPAGAGMTLKHQIKK
jgi:hypothetical protein